MKAFLSHSSKDKHIVDRVASQLGAGSSIYDRESFEEGKRSADEILRGLAHSDLFVLFLSRNSIASPWVNAEIAEALQKKFSGKLKSILVFALDDTGHSVLPEWLATYTVERTDKPAQISRRIRSRLIELELEQGEQADIFVGREKELHELQRALTLPSEEMASVFSVTGWQGLGRRTLVRRAIQQTFPNLKRFHPAVALSDNDAVEDFHRKLLDVAFGVSQTSAEWRTAIEDFQKKNHVKRVAQLLDLISQITHAKEILFVIGDRGLIHDNGDFVPYVRDLIRQLPRAPRPQLVLVYRRKMSLARQSGYSQIYFASVNAFAYEEAAELLGAHLKQREVMFSREDLDDLVRFVGGHPENIRLAAEYAHRYGLAQLRREKSDFLDITVFRALEVIKRIRLSELAKAVCTTLLDYQYLQIEDFVVALNGTDVQILEQLRDLEDQGVIERVGQYYRISPYLVDAIARSDFAQDHKNERKAVGQRLLTVLSQVEEFDHVSLSLMNAATLAAIRSGKLAESPMLVRYLLPSHLLTIAREAYDNSDYRAAADLCKEALENKSRLTENAQIEAYRLLSIALLRLGDRSNFEKAIEELGRYHGRTAKRNQHFLLGLRARLDGLIDEAVREYRIAYEIDHQNFHVLRELAHILVLQSRFSEAERYARTAYEIARTNAFIIDVLCETIIGKESAKKLSENTELAKLLHELNALGTTQGRSFYDERMVLLMYKLGDRETAWKHANGAVKASPRHLGPRATRVHIGLKLGRLEKIDEDIGVLQAAVSSVDRKGDRFLVDRARIAYAISKGDLVNAKSQLDRAHMLPDHVRRDLEAELRSAIEATGHEDPQLRKWARESDRRRTKSRARDRSRKRPG